MITVHPTGKHAKRYRRRAERRTARAAEMYVARHRRTTLREIAQRISDQFSRSLGRIVG